MRLVPALAVLTALAFPSQALAIEAFVDKETGNDANQATDCQQANPCQSIAAGINAATGAANGTVHLDDSSVAYDQPSGVSLFNGVSVIADEFVGGDENPKPIVTASANPQIFFISGTGPDIAGRISGLTLRTNDNTGIVDNGVLSEISNNDFADANASGGDRGLTVGAGSPLIKDNVFTGLNRPILLNGTNPTVSGNDISGTRGPSRAIELSAGSATITGNFIHAPASISVDGIAAGSGGSDTVGSMTLRRNRIDGMNIGVNFLNISGPLTLNGDLVTNSRLLGVVGSDTNTSGDTDFQVTNATVVSAPGTAQFEIQADDATATIDSSIVGALGATAVGAGNCAISFSRGPTTAGNSCQTFQTSADPMFVSGTDFHLQPGSPMIDAGNPADPGAGILDVDGQARVQEGNGACPTVRDIGADEVPGSPIDCSGSSGGGGGGGGGPAADTDAPETKFKSKPKKRSDDTTPTFKFGSDEGGSTFRCKLDKGKFKPCATKKTFHVKPGAHKLQVAAVDPAGNADPSPATFKFTVLP